MNAKRNQSRIARRIDVKMVFSYRLEGVEGRSRPGAGAALEEAGWVNITRRLCRRSGVAHSQASEPDRQQDDGSQYRGEDGVEQPQSVPTQPRMEAFRQGSESEPGPGGGQSPDDQENKQGDGIQKDLRRIPGFQGQTTGLL